MAISNEWSPKEQELAENMIRSLRSLGWTQGDAEDKAVSFLFDRRERMIAEGKDPTNG